MTPHRRSVGLFLALALFVHAQAATPPTDKSGTPTLLPAVKVSADVPLVKVGEHTMRTPRFGPAAVVHGDAIYTIGGAAGPSGAESSIERFDVKTGRSEAFTELKQPRLWHNAVLVGNKIYVLGGSVPTSRTDSNGGPRTGLALDDSVEIVDVETRQVTAGPRMRAGRNQFGCVVAGGKIYVIGGMHAGTMRAAATNTVDVLDLATGKWSAGTPMPTPRLPAAALVDGGFIVVPGGYTGTRALDVVEVYDPKRNTWSTLPPLARSRSAHSIVFLGSHLFLFGDYSDPQELLAYNLKTKNSEIFTLGYTPARHNAVVKHGEKIYVIGGRAHRDDVGLDLIQVFALTATRPASR